MKDLFIGRTSCKLETYIHMSTPVVNDKVILRKCIYVEDHRSGVKLAFC